MKGDFNFIGKLGFSKKISLQQFDDHLKKRKSSWNKLEASIVRTNWINWSELVQRKSIKLI